MSLLSGVLEAANGVAGNVAHGGAASAALKGAKDQVGNVRGYFCENVDSVRKIAGGHLKFLNGSAGLIGNPTRGAARLNGNSLAGGRPSWNEAGQENPKATAALEKSINAW